MALGYKNYGKEKIFSFFGTTSKRHSLQEKSDIHQHKQKDALDSNCTTNDFSFVLESYNML